MRRNTLRTALAVGLVVVLVLLLLAGFGFLLAAVYLRAAAHWGSATGALVTSGITFVLAGILLWLTFRAIR